jgi:alkylhydroperoxidase family enzyme
MAAGVTYYEAMSEAANRLRLAAIERALRGPGVASIEARRAAFDNSGSKERPVDGDERGSALVDKVARHAWKVTDADVAAAKAAGLSEDEIFELVVCAAYGQADRQFRAALAALDAATKGTP